MVLYFVVYCTQRLEIVVYGSGPENKSSNWSVWISKIPKLNWWLLFVPVNLPTMAIHKQQTSLGNFPSLILIQKVAHGVASHTSEVSVPGALGSSTVVQSCFQDTVGSLGVGVAGRGSHRTWHLCFPSCYLFLWRLFQPKVSQPGPDN